MGIAITSSIPGYPKLKNHIHNQDVYLFLSPSQEDTSNVICLNGNRESFFISNLISHQDLIDREDYDSVELGDLLLFNYQNQVKIISYSPFNNLLGLWRHNATNRVFLCLSYTEDNGNLIYKVILLSENHTNVILYFGDIIISQCIKLEQFETVKVGDLYLFNTRSR